MTEQSWPAVPTGDPPVYPDGGVELNIGRHRTMFADRTGVVGYPGSTDRSVFADSSGLFIKRRAGARWIQGIYGTDDDEKSLAVETPHGTLWRVDRVVDRLTPDGVIKTFVKAGTAAAEPVAPALTQTPGGTWEESLATFRVKPAALSITVADASVADERRFTPVTVTPVAAAALRSATPRVGDEVIYPDGRRERWSGSAWVTIVRADDVARTPWTMGVSTAWNWPFWSGNTGTYSRRDGRVWANARTGLSDVPPFANVLTFTWPPLGPPLQPAVTGDAFGQWWHCRGGALVASGHISYGGGAPSVEAIAMLGLGHYQCTPAQGDQIVAMFDYMT